MPAARALLALPLLALLTVPLSAGTGRIADGKLDLLVYFAYDETDPAAWEPVFTEYSRLLLNATEGGLQLGRVSFTVCPDLADEADVWVLNDFSGARAHLNGLGVLGRHMTISQTHKSTGGGALGQFGLAHETGHYVFGCYDEYRGFLGNVPTSSSLFFCSFENSSFSCLMDGGTTLFPNNIRTEFCTRTALGLPETLHNPGVLSEQGAYLTDQAYYLGRSCWEQIQISGRAGLTQPSSEPSFAAPPHDPVVFDTARLQGDLAVAIVLDRSGSMSAEGRLTQAVQGAKNGIGLMRDGEFLSIVTFADTPSVIFGATAVNATLKTIASNALDGVTAGGGTVLGTAVQTAVGQLATVQGCVELVILVTDGVSGDPNIDDPAVVAALTGGDHALYAVAVGSFPEVDALNAVATATGGAFYAVSDASELPGVLASIFATAGAGTPVLESFEDALPAGGLETRAFQVGEGAALLRVDLAFASGADLELELTAPDGTVLPFDAPPTGVTVFESDVQKAMSVPTPLAGDWTAAVQAPGAGAAAFDLLAFVEQLDLDVSTAAAAERVAYPEPMRVSVSAVAGVPVGGVTVTARVDRPDGSTVPVVFHDDGLAVHGDEKPDDGVYGTLFARYAGDGAYTFRIEVDGSGGFAASNQECGVYGRAAAGSGEDGQSTFPIPDFFACARHTVVLEGFVVPPAPGALALEEHAAFVPPGSVARMDGPTAVAAFRLDATPDEPVVLERVALAVQSSGDDVNELDGLALHVDTNGDGLVDVPSVPLALGALGALAADGLRLAFERPGGELLFLPPGSSTHLLVTAGAGLTGAGTAREPRPAGAGGTGGAAGGTLDLAPPPGGALAFGGALLLVAVLLACGARRRVRPLALGLVAGALVLGFPACGGGSSGSGSARVGLTANAVEATGAVTGAPAPVAGDARAFAFALD
jgi:Mg-chelatase subunit ChlD